MRRGTLTASSWVAFSTLMPFTWTDDKSRAGHCAFTYTGDRTEGWADTLTCRTASPTNNIPVWSAAGRKSAKCQQTVGAIVLVMTVIHAVSAITEWPCVSVSVHVHE